MKTQKYYIILFIISFVTLMSFKTFSKEINSLEKIYTQTDRSFYFPGETIWFKSYIVAKNNTISTINDIVNAELISPKGAVVKKVKLNVSEGYAYGDFHIDENWVGGIYTLKVYTNWMRNFGEESFFTKKITVQKVVQPNLLLQLKFEKEGYGKSSEVVANFNVKDLKNNPLKNKKVKFEVTVKGEKIISHSIHTDSKGKAKPTFTLPTNLTSTDVVLNVLIPYNGTTESISRSVPVVLDNIDLQFFPESGKIIARTLNKIAYKAINEFAKPVAIEGIIFDENDTKIITFNSFHDGMGSFDFKPKKNKTYYAKITAPFLSTRKIILPKTYTKGTRFSVATDSIQTSVKIFSTNKTPLYLEVSNGTEIILKRTISHQNKKLFLDTKNLPIGITKFSILTEKKEIVAERLVFINEHKKLNIKISLNKEIYKTREKVKVTINTTDENNNPIPSNLSIAIADNKLLSFADDKQDHILSSLLLSSELKGKIYKPSFYFNPKEPKSSLAIDYLMLTHGWRDYINTSDISIENAQFKPAQKGTRSGVTVDKNGKPIKANLLLFDTNGNKILVFESNENGQFYFKVDNKYSLTLIAYREDGAKITVIKDKYNPGFYVEDANSKTIKNEEKIKAFSKNNKTLKKTIKEKAVANISLNEDANALDEVIVVGYGTQKKSHLTGAIGSVKKESLIEVGNNATQILQGKVAGVNVTQGFTPGTSPKITIRGTGSISGNSSPLIVIDGIPSDSNALSSLNTNLIEAIKVLKNASSTAIYGSAGANGVILVTTKHGNFYNNSNKKRLKFLKYKNYATYDYYNDGLSNIYNSKSFYIPKYNSNKIVEERTDFRQTIYWNPVVQTDENGEAKFEFYNSDAITSFKITSEGIGYNSLVGRQEKTYATHKIINIDFKAPNYMALNDTIVLPVTIINENKKNIEASLDLELPKSLKLLAPFDKNVFIKAKETLVKHIKIVPIKKEENTTLTIKLKGNDFTDIVKRKATILSPYFPIETSISGSKSKKYNFNITNPVNNSIKADFNIYTDIVGDVMDGIEGLIRQPSGCFEQTSSSTYPNIMVLKYLNESGKVNPEIEKKALDYIKKGYQRLISFETKEGGFEWFGHTPPHETLTAYGILEFTEMKEVYNGVSQKMIDRTVQWLLSRKDGKGGFKKSKKGYDSFASSLTDIANAYIIYALSEAKIKADINLEYETAYDDAIKTNDTYKMALLALTSYNLNKSENAKTLITNIKANINEYDFKTLPVKNTITRSYGDAKNIETVAFSLLALMREENNNDFLIAKGIDYLISKRQYNKFGSTQSTAMALKALIEYTKSQNQKIIANNETVTLTINGKKIKNKLTLNNKGKITIDNFSSYFKEGKQNVTVHFTNPKTTFPYNLNVTWDSHTPNSSKECALALETITSDKPYKVGDNVSMNIDVKNKKHEKLGMATAIIGIPSGTTAQPWQLKELLEEHKMAYYEVFDNYLVFYWREFDVLETKTIRLDLKADIAGSYKAPASTVYLYYGDEHKTWISGNKLTIEN